MFKKVFVLKWSFPKFLYFRVKLDETLLYFRNFRTIKSILTRLMFIYVIMANGVFLNVEGKMC